MLAIEFDSREGRAHCSFGLMSSSIAITREGCVMNNLAVPCPSCGSIEVVVEGRADLPVLAPGGGDEKPYVPRCHPCTCTECRHTFQHDFAFSR